MNKVKERSLTKEALKFKFASDKLFSQAKYIKLFIFFLAIISVVISIIPAIKAYSFIATIASFSITIISALISQFLSDIKESAILERQLYEAEITGSTLAKIEYDRETTNALHELAIRKGLPKVNKSKKNPYVDVPQSISDDYSYLYLIRLDAARNNFLLSRFYYVYLIILGLIIISLISLAIIETDTTAYLQLIIGFYPLITPIIKNLSSCRKASKNNIKICADIDNFFADGDDSLERLARFYYYAQNLEFEMLVNRPVMYKIITKLFNHGVNVLSEGVTYRFENAIIELRKKNLMLSSGIAIPKAKDLITRHDYTLEELVKKSERKKKTLEKKIIPLLNPKSNESTVENSITIKKTKSTSTKPKNSTSQSTTKAKTTTKPKTTTSSKSKSKSSTTKTKATTKSSKKTSK